MNDKQNPFQEMQNEQIRAFFEGPADRKIKARLDGTMGTFRLLGNIADVYLNRFVDTMVGMANGANAQDEEEVADQGRLPASDDLNDDSKYPNL